MTETSTRRLTLISVPFHLGTRAVGMGNGPLALLGQWMLPDRLRAAGHEVEVVEVPEPTAEQQVARIFELARHAAGLTRAARRSGRLPILVAGNCSVCLGALGGIGAARCGIVWLDAHADFHTPDTTESGFFDGMGLAIATGSGWRALARSVPELTFVAERNTVLVGTRDVDAGERQRLQTGSVTVVEGGRGPGRLAFDDLERAVAWLATRVDGVYLHVDLDSLDTELGRANEFATDGGLGLEDLATVASIVVERTAVLAMSFTAYNPDVEPGFGQVAVSAIETTVGSVSS